VKSALSIHAATTASLCLEAIQIFNQRQYARRLKTIAPYRHFPRSAVCRNAGSPVNYLVDPFPWENAAVSFRNRRQVRQVWSLKNRFVPPVAFATQAVTDGATHFKVLFTDIDLVSRRCSLHQER